MFGRRRHRWTSWQKLAASLGILVGVFLLAEVAARGLGAHAVAWNADDRPGVLMAGHPTRLWAMAPGARVNGDALATIGDHGLRGPPPTVPRPAGRSRVLVLGDSSFFGHGLGDADTLPAQLEVALRGAGLDADVINGAIPGYSTEQSRRLLEELGWALEPTLLLVGNLWSDNNADAFRDVDLLQSRALAAQPLGRSAFVRLVVGWADRLRGGEGARVVTWTRTSAWPEGRQRRVPVQDYARNLDHIVREARSRGVGVGFVAPVNLDIALGRTPKGAPWDVYFAAQAAVAAWHGVPVVSARAALAADPLGAEALFVDAMHPSARGCADIARETVRVLVGAGWPSNLLTGRAAPFDASALYDTVDANQLRQAGQPRDFSPQAKLFPGVLDMADRGEPPLPAQVGGEEPRAAGAGAAYGAAETPKEP